MPTHVLSKKAFLAFLDKNVKETDAVIFTQELTKATASKKAKSKRTEFIFASEVFAQEDSVNTFYTGQTPAAGIVICPQEQLSELSKNLLKENE